MTSLDILITSIKIFAPAAGYRVPVKKSEKVILEIVGESEMELCRQIWTFLLSVFEKVLYDYAIDFSKLKKFIEISSYIL